MFSIIWTMVETEVVLLSSLLAFSSAGLLESTTGLSYISLLPCLGDNCLSSVELLPAFCAKLFSFCNKFISPWLVALCWQLDEHRCRSTRAFVVR